MSRRGIRDVTEEPRQIDEVTHELPCARCGYILRGLAESGACPECGEAIETSLKGNLLRAADPRWLKTVARGVGWTAWGVRYVFLGFLFVLLVLFGGEPFYYWLDETSSLLEVIKTLGYVVSGLWMLTPIVIAVGWWMVAAPEPRDEDAGSGYSVVRRVLAALVVPALGLWFGLSSKGLTTSWPAVTKISVIHLCLLIVLAQVWTMHQRLIALNGRLAKQPRHGYVRRSGWRRWMAFLLPLVFLILYWIGPLRSLRGPQSGWSLPNDKSHFAFFFITFLFWLSTAHIVGKYRPSIRNECAEAQRARAEAT